MQHEPLTFKEMEYIVDSMSNEDLLMKQCVMTASTASNTNVQTICRQLLNTHEQHYNTLTEALKQHLPLAPNQIQQ